MDKECGMHQILEINLTAGNGAEKIIQEIAASPLREKLILRDDKFLGKEWYGEHLVNYLEFFTPKSGLADTAGLLEKLFPKEFPNAQDSEQDGDCSQTEGEERAGSDQKPEKGEKASQAEGVREGKTGNFQEIKDASEGTEGQCRVFLYQNLEGKWKDGGEPLRIYLKVVKWPFQIPFVLELIPFEGATLPLLEKALEPGVQQEEKAIYRMFTAEEYLSRGFYHIMDDLELVYSLSWYRDIYSILTGHVVEGRKVSQSFGQLLLENAIPRLEERLKIIGSFDEYGYMQKRWENFCKRAANASKGKQMPNVQEKTEGDGSAGQAPDVSQPEGKIGQEASGSQTETGECYGEEGTGSSYGFVEYPEWGQVIQLLVKFISPVVDATLRDELFIGDWMPQFGRYIG